MSDQASGFEALRHQIEELRPASDASDRSVVWADPAHTVGVARDPHSRLEIFVVGGPLDAVDRVIAENLDHRVWTTAAGLPLPANRLVLPAADHFDGVAAFICSELIANGVSDSVAAAFRRSEPVIALALRRATLGNQVLVGLAGELFVLARLVDAWPERAAQVVAGWFGSRPSSRDLQLGPIGIEIKTTTQSESVHHIQGIHQVERGVSVDDEPETHLFLLSVGIEWLPAGSTTGFRIPELVEKIAASLADSAQRDEFLDRVHQYGGDTGIGYDHRTQQRSQRYRRPFHTRFERLYDLDDDRIRLLLSPDVAIATNVDVDSISYRIRLPAQVRGDINPVAGISLIAATLASLAEIDATTRIGAPRHR